MTARLQEAISLQQKGEIEKAKVAYEKILQENPKFIDTYFYLSMANVELQDLSAAVTVLQTGLNHFPENIV